MTILTVLVVVCLLNALVFLQQDNNDPQHEFSIGKYHVEGQQKYHSVELFRRKNNKKKRHGGKTTQKDGYSNGSDPRLHEEESVTSGSLRSKWEATHSYKTEFPKRRHYPTISTIPYDVFDCPMVPEKNYPMTFPAKTVLSHWNVDHLRVPSDYHHGSLCVFDWEKDHEKIRIYQMEEVPFVVIRHPEIYRTTQRWEDDAYLSELVGHGEPQRTEYSENNHLMFWRMRGRVPKSFVPPTKDIKMTFDEWKLQADRIASIENAKNEPHWYLRYNENDHNADLYHELPFFDPERRHPDFLVDKSQERGINCRFGMAGGIAEAHFDQTRNWILLLGGTGPRRYILSHPSQCSKYMLYPPNHPSGRHASINWSTEYETEPFASAELVETVLQVSDALYLPTSWLHFIVALGTNYQCNDRSGVTTENNEFLEECGFDVPVS